MKILITKARGHGVYTDTDALGKIHIEWPIDTTACGLAYEMYDIKPTREPITCSTCNMHLEWAKRASKIKI